MPGRRDPDRINRTPEPWANAAAVAIGLALVATLVVGFLLRWLLAGRLALGWDFGHLLHAHSHLGYYAVLFPLAWLGWRQAGATSLPARVLAVYAVATAVAFFGFVRAGYGPEAIAGSTVVGAIWLVSAWPHRVRWRTLGDPLAAVLPGVVFAMICIPPIAILLRRDPALARAFVATFLAMLLLAVIIPSALAARRLTAPWPALLVAAVFGAASLGIWPAAPARIGLAAYAALVAWAVWRNVLALHLRLVWLTMVLGLLAVALGALPNTRSVMIGAIHFAVLGPVLATLAESWLRGRLPVWAWWLSHASAAALAGPLVAQGLGTGFWTATASAIGGSCVLAWWTLVLLLTLRRSAMTRDQV